MRRLELLQWFGLLAAPLAWAVQLVVGFGVAEASCARAGGRAASATGRYRLTASDAVSSQARPQ